MLIRPHIKLLFCPRAEKEFFLQLYYLLGFLPNNTFYYHKAFTHKSSNFIGDKKNKLTNERLEFLGDTIIDSIVADFLFTSYPHETEGFLTKMKSKIVNRKSLNHIAIQLKLQSYIQSNIPNIKENDALGNAFEALMGAIYLDKGYEFTKKYLVSQIIAKYFDLRYLEQNDSNYKSQLIELIQKKKSQIVFNTDIDSENSTESNLRFITVILIDDVEISKSEGANKKEAEQNASKLALEILEK